MKDPLLLTTPLRPCPFCGGTRIEPVNYQPTVARHWCLRCVDCGAEGPPDLGRSGAAESWNNRVAHPEN